ncbi:MAG: STAS domain-containing protein [Planctomycetales bacterium]|nr:STAS domain-containing protein [Planctomycetales bacterium]
MVDALATLSDDWAVDVDRGPDWLFVKLHPGSQDPGDVAEKLLSVADKHFVYRMVLEMDEVDFIPSRLIGQLVMLQKRVLQRHGMLRLCQLKDQCAEAIHMCRLDGALPNYGSREDAVLGRDQRCLSDANVGVRA